MIDELVDLMPDFSGKASQTRCFNHILNLVARTVTKQFDVPTKKGGELSEAERVLNELADGLELEEEEMLQKARENGGGEDDGEDGDSLEGWIDEQMFLTDKEREELDETVLPVRTVIVKVSRDDIRTAGRMALTVSCIATAMKIGLQNSELVDAAAAGVEETLGGLEDGGEIDAARRENSM